MTVLADANQPTLTVGTPIVATSRCGAKALGHLELNHHPHPRDHRRTLQQPDDDGNGHVVRKVGHNRPVALVPQQAVPVDAECIARFHPRTSFGWHPLEHLPQHRDQVFVLLRVPERPHQPRRAPVSGFPPPGPPPGPATRDPPPRGTRSAERVPGSVTKFWPRERRAPRSLRSSRELISSAPSIRADPSDEPGRRRLLRWPSSQLPPLQRSRTSVPPAPHPPSPPGQDDCAHPGAEPAPGRGNRSPP